MRTDSKEETSSGAAKGARPQAGLSERLPWHPVDGASQQPRESENHGQSGPKQRVTSQAAVLGYFDQMDVFPERPNGTTS